MSRDDSCPEDARAFARWDRLGDDCGHESELTYDGECVVCLKLAEEDACAADHEREYDKDAAWERAQDEAAWARSGDADGEP